MAWTNQLCTFSKPGITLIISIMVESPSRLTTLHVFGDATEVAHAAGLLASIVSPPTASKTLVSCEVVVTLDLFSPAERRAYVNLRPGCYCAPAQDLPEPLSCSCLTEPWKERAEVSRCSAIDL